MSSSTYLTFIVSGRNDGYGKNYALRLHNFLNSIRILSELEKVYTETIVVEWNPVQGTQTLSEKFKFPKNKYNSVRYIIIPLSFHNKFPNPRKLPLHDYVAKNVGIVRAKGEYIMVCSGDLIFPKELFKLFNQQILQEGIIYRNTRLDYIKFKDDLLTIENYDSYIKDIKKRITTNNYRGGNKIYDLFVTQIPLKDKYYCNRPGGKFYSNACGDFILMSKKNWIDVNGCVCDTNYFTHLDGATIRKILQSGIKEMVFHPKYSFFHMDHERPHMKKKNNPYPKATKNIGDWGYSKEIFNEIQY